MSFWIGNIMLLILNLPLITIWVRMLTIPYTILFPSILFFVCIGVYSVNNNSFDVFMVLAFGIIGYGMKILDYPVAPLLLGFVLGPIIEEHLRRALQLSRGDYSVFITEPVSAGFLLATLGMLLLVLWPWLRHRWRREQVG